MAMLCAQDLAETLRENIRDAAFASAWLRAGEYEAFTADDIEEIRWLLSIERDTLAGLDGEIAAYPCGS